MKFKKISTRMLAVIVPIMIIAMAALTIISILKSREAINGQIHGRMRSELSAAVENIEQQMTGVVSMATTISDAVAATYASTSISYYEDMLAEIIQGNDKVLGSGLWFEPNAYIKNQEYVGPYIYKDNADIVVTYDYATPEYDYFSQEYYKRAKDTKSVIITEPYYDAITGKTMSSCSAPILVKGYFIGCVTVDVELSSITSWVESISVGERGRAVLVNSSGVYLAGVTGERISDAVNIRSDSNASLAAAGNDIMSSESGQTSCTTVENGREYLYYTTIPLTGWKFFIHMPVSEIHAPILNLMFVLMVVSALTILVEVFIVIFQIRNISKGIGEVKNFAGYLAKGDFSVEPISIKSQDELGVMGNSLNDMYIGNKEVIQNIVGCAGELDSAVGLLNRASAELNEQFYDISEMTNRVNAEMVTSGEATGQLSASAEAVLSNANLLSGMTDKTREMGEEIQNRAAQIAEQSKNSLATAGELARKFSRQLQESMEGAKVVENISTLADIISNIADQIDLLSLNASIESARAGEAGRGFAVVAGEIGNLAGNTSQTVVQIQNTITQVQSAFTNLMDAANGLLDFVQNTVAPDYQNFVGVAEQYGKDAESFKTTSGDISEMAAGITMIIGEVTDEIHNITGATQETTDISSHIMSSIHTMSEHMSDVTGMALTQQQIANSLLETVGKFQL